MNNVQLNDIQTRRKENYISTYQQGMDQVEARIQRVKKHLKRNADPGTANELKKLLSLVAQTKKRHAKALEENDIKELHNLVYIASRVVSHSSVMLNSMKEHSNKI